MILLNFKNNCNKMIQQKTIQFKNRKSNKEVKKVRGAKENSLQSKIKKYRFYKFNYLTYRYMNIF